MPTAPAIALIGASAGGPRVLHDLVAGLPRPAAVPLILVQHMTPLFVPHFISWLASRSSLPVVEARPEACLSPGYLYVIARKPTLVFAPRRPLELSAAPERETYAPSVDRVFSSAARVFGRRVFAVLLSGMGTDGAAGLKCIADAGGRTIVQDEASATFPGMPTEARRLSNAHETLSRDGIAMAVNAAVGGEPRAPWSP